MDKVRRLQAFGHVCRSQAFGQVCRSQAFGQVSCATGWFVREVALAVLRTKSMKT